MKFFLAVPSLVLLGACATVGPAGQNYASGTVSYEDSHVLQMRDGPLLFKSAIGQPPTPAQEQLWARQAFTTGVIDDGERRAINLMIGANILDIGSTYLGLHRGCGEASFLLGKSPALPAIVALKAATTSYYIYAAKKTPLNRSLAKAGYFNAGLTTAVGVRNLLLKCGA